MTALVDRLEQLERVCKAEIGEDAALIVELRHALPALLTALRAAHALLDDAGAVLEHMAELDAALAPLFGEDTTP